MANRKGRGGPDLAELYETAAGGQLIRLPAHAPRPGELVEQPSLLLPPGGEAAGPLPEGGAHALLTVRQLGQVLTHRQQRVLLPETTMF
jgi:hypothetical protein